MRFTTSFARASGLIVAGTLAAGMPAAVAEPALTTASSNVRGGPGMGYEVLGTLPAGAPVNVVGCSGSWCQTQYGYVSARLLSQGTAGYAPAAGYAAPAFQSPGTNYRQPASAASVHTYSSYPAATPAGAAALGYGAAAPVVAGTAGVAAERDAVHPGTDTTMAGPRTTIGTTNVRSGPGVEYEVTKTLPDFTKVEVMGCANGWCQTNEGYISIYLLSRGPVQQVLNEAAQPRVPGSQTRDSLAWNAGAQAAMGYGAPGAAVQGYTPATRTGYPVANYARTSPQLARGSAAGVLGAAGAALTTASSNVRGGPGMGYEVLGTLPAGAPVNVVGCSGSWCQTQYGYVSARLLSQGTAGYAPAAGYAAPAFQSPGTNYRQPASAASVHTYSSYPAATPAGAAALGYGAAAPVVAGTAGVAAERDAVHPGTDTTMAGPRTTIGTTNVRSGPGVEYEVTKTLPDFTKVEVMGCANGWCQTNEGYISIYLLSRGPVQQVLNEAAQPRVPGSQTRDSLAWNAGAQAAMGYGAPGAAVQGYTPATRTGYPVAGASALGYAPSTTVGTYATAGTATTRASVKVRSGPGTAYDVLGTLPAGAPVDLVGCTGSWCQTQYGYVSAGHLDLGGNASAGSNYRRARAAPAVRNYPVGTNIGTVRISPSQAPRYLGAPGRGAAVDPANAAVATTLSDLNVRGGPGTSYDVLGTLPAGSPVDIVACVGSWCQTQYGYVSSRHLSSDAEAGAAPARAADISGVDYSSATYVDPALADTAVAYGNVAEVQEIYPQGGYVTAASLPVQATLGGIETSQGGYGRGVGWTNWRTSWGPGYWGPALHGRNVPSNWGARTSYWGGRTSYWNVHPGYPTRAYVGDRRGNYYWSRRGEGRLPQSASWYGMGPRWQGPYAEGPGYNGRPVLWQARSGVW